MGVTIDRHSSTDFIGVPHSKECMNSLPLWWTSAQYNRL